MLQKAGSGRSYFSEDFDFGETFEEYHVDPWEDVQKYLKKKKLSCTDQKIAQVRDENKEQVRIPDIPLSYRLRNTYIAGRHLGIRPNEIK